jgi:hypothetical protein
MYVIVQSPIGPFDIRPHGPPPQLWESIMNLVRRFIDQIGFVLDARMILVLGSIEIGWLVHVEPYSIVFSNPAIFVETVFPPLSDVWG